MQPESLAVLIPILVPLGVFLMIYAVSKQESEVKKKMIENGMNPKDISGRKLGSGALKAGGLLIGGGLGLFLAKMLDSTGSFGHDPEAIYFGLIALFGGIGLVIAHNVARKQYKEDKKDGLL